MMPARTGVVDADLQVADDFVGQLLLGSLADGPAVEARNVVARAHDDGQSGLAGQRLEGERVAAGLDGAQVDHRLATGPAERRNLFGGHAHLPLDAIVE